MTETRIISSRTRRETMGILPQPARSPEWNLLIVNPRTKSWGRIAETLKRREAAWSHAPVLRRWKRLTQKMWCFRRWWGSYITAQYHLGLFCRWSQGGIQFQLRAMLTSHMRYGGLGYKERKLRCGIYQITWIVFKFRQLPLNMRIAWIHANKSPPKTTWETYNSWQMSTDSPSNIRDKFIETSRLRYSNWPHIRELK